MKVTMISDMSLSTVTISGLSNFLSTSPQGNRWRTGQDQLAPSHHLGALQIHLLSSHPWERLASVRSQQPLAPAGFQRLGGAPQPDSGYLSVLCTLAGRSPKQVFFPLGRQTGSYCLHLRQGSNLCCCKQLIPRKKNDLHLQKSM